MTSITIFLRRPGALMPVLLLAAIPAAAQPNFPAPVTQPSYSPPAPAPGGRSQACVRLESQLAMIDRGGVDPSRAAEIKRYEDAAAKQQADLDRLSQQSQRLGCQSGFFSIFSGQSPQCMPLNNQIQQVRGNLDRLLMDSQRLQGNSGEREAQRRGVLVALGQNDCGPQYRQYVNNGPGGFLENLFGGNLGGFGAPSSDVSSSGTYRTLCVRTCDGYYFPVSYSTVPSRFGEDEQLCHRMCPATETVLYSHRNPGEDISRAVSLNGRPYSDLPTAFSYRKQFNAACSCRLPGQSWADALQQGDDQTIERGDIVVTEEKARQLSQPRFDAQGKPVNIDPAPGPSGRPVAAPKNAARPAMAAPPSTAAPPPAAAAEDKAAEEDPAKRKVRAVGPTFLPVR